MKSFAAWLHDVQPDAPDLAALRTFAANNVAHWPYWSDDPADFIAAIRAAAPPLPAADQDALIATLARYFARWKCEQAAPAPGLIDNIASHFGKIALLVFGLAFLWLLRNGLSGDFYASLGNTEQVRGLVTFFFVLSTTGIIVLFALSIFWLNNSTDVTERFKSAKDLLTIVIGVLGTIMGFYFGSATGEGAKMSISALSPPVVHVGETPTITGHISGGTKPYKFTVVFTDPSKTLTDDQLKALSFEGDSPDGTVSKKMTPPPVQAPVAAAYELSATDNKNAKATSSGTLYLEPKKAP